MADVCFLYLFCVTHKCPGTSNVCAMTWEMADTSEACSMLLLSGMTPAEMHACLVEGQMEVARGRIAHLKRLVSTFTGEMLLVINEAQSEPVICSFAGMEEAG